MLRGLNTGRLDILITVEQPTLTPNSIGENETTWSTYKTMYMARSQEAGEETFEAKQTVNIEKLTGFVRYDSGLTTRMRLKQEQDTTYFYIRNVRQWRREGYSQLVAQRRDN